MDFQSEHITKLYPGCNISVRIAGAGPPCNPYFFSIISHKSRPRKKSPAGFSLPAGCVLANPRDVPEGEGL